MTKQPSFRFQFLLLLSLVLTTGLAEAQISRLASVSLNGRDHVRVSDVARVCGMNVSVSGRIVTLRSQTASLVLEVDDREARLNEVKVLLNFAPTVSGGRTWIARVDAIKAIEPVLFPPRDGPNSAFRAIVIDPGHGGADQGGAASGLLEKTVNLDVAKRVQQLLAQQGFVVTLTRTGDSTLSLDRRVRIVNELRADLFVCIHFNTEPRGRSARGIETYCLTPSGGMSTASSRTFNGALAGNLFDASNMLLAYQVQRNVLAATDASDRGVRRARFYLLQYAKCPAILVEGGFLTNTGEAANVATANYRDRIANGIADGILAYKRVLDR